MEQLIGSSLSVHNVDRTSYAVVAQSTGSAFYRANASLMWMARGVGGAAKLLGAFALLGGCAATPTAHFASANPTTQSVVYADEMSQGGNVRRHVTSFSTQGEEAKPAWTEEHTYGPDLWGNTTIEHIYHRATPDTRSWRAIVPVWIDGNSTPLHFLVDTGADRTTVSTRCFNGPVECRPGGNVTVANGMRQSVGLRDFSIGSCGFKFDSMECEVADMPDLDGVIGQDFLRHFKVTFDYPNLELILECRD